MTEIECVSSQWQASGKQPLGGAEAVPECAGGRLSPAVWAVPVHQLPRPVGGAQLRSGGPAASPESSVSWEASQREILSTRCDQKLRAMSKLQK